MSFQKVKKKKIIAAICAGIEHFVITKQRNIGKEFK